MLRINFVKYRGCLYKESRYLVGGAVAQLAAAAAAPAEDPAVHGERYAVLRAGGEATVGYPLGAQRPHLFTVYCGFKPRRIGNSKIEVIYIASDGTPLRQLGYLKFFL